MSHARDVRSALIVLGVAACLVAAAANGGENWKLPPGRDFPLVGGNWANQRYSTLDKINPSNIKSLGAAWTVHLEDGKPAGNMHATPIVIDGTMFLSSGAGNVFAIDAKTAAIKWKYRSE